MINIQTVFCSNHYTKFTCKMGACKSSCCSENWGIEVLEKEHDFLVGNGIDQDIFKFFVDEEGGRFIEIVPHGQNCPLRQEDGLCKIQCAFGEEALFDTCVVFPRSYGKIGERIEACLDTACEYATELVLFGEPFQLVEQRMKTPRYFDVEISKKMMKKRLGSSKNYFLFQHFLSHLLYDIQMPIAEKILLIGIFTQKSKFPIKHKKYIRKVEKWNQYTKEDFEMRLKSCNKDEKFKNSVMESLYALFLVENENVFEFSAAWEGQSEIDEAAMTNFVANYLFAEKYPFSMTCQKIDTMAAYGRFALTFAFLQYILKGTPELTKEKLCKIVFLYTRNIDHDVNFLNEALEKIEELNMDNLALFTTLLL